MNDVQLMAVAATYATHNEHVGRTSVHLEKLGPPITEIKRLQIYALDGTATRSEIDHIVYCITYI